MSISLLSNTQNHVVSILERFLRSGKIPHSILFFGPSGSGKTHYAHSFSKDLLCLDPCEGFACHQCISCKAWDNRAHPDMHHFYHTAGSPMGIDLARKIQSLASWKPVYGDKKVIHIDDFHMMTVDALNSMLKSLEEPSGSTWFIMTTSQIDALLPTILSRTVRIPFYRLSDAKVKELIDAYDIDSDWKEKVIAWSRGNLKRAIELIREEDRTEITSWAKALSELLENPLAPFPVLPKTKLEKCLELWKILIRAKYCMKLSRPKSDILYGEGELKEKSERVGVDLEQLLNIQDRLVQLEVDLRRTRIHPKSNIDAWMIKSKQLMTDKV
jgi:DNA polymerase III subunit delta'